MYSEKDDGWNPYQSSGIKKVLKGEAVHPYYYLAVLLYVVYKSQTDQQKISDFFEALKNLFINYISHPPSVIVPVKPTRLKQSIEPTDSIHWADSFNPLSRVH